MSLRLTTPTARPASLTTGAPLKPRSTSVATASLSGAASGIETTCSVINSAAVWAFRRSEQLLWVQVAIMAGLPYLAAADGVPGGTGRRAGAVMIAHGVK